MRREVLRDGKGNIRRKKGRGEEVMRRGNKERRKEVRWGEGGGEMREDRGGWRICFWNVAGLKNKDGEFFLVGAEEVEGGGKWYSWRMEERGWRRRINLKERLSEGYKWEVQLASCKNKKRRTIGGILMGIRKELVEKGEMFEVKDSSRDGKVRKEVWKIVVYI